MVDSKSTISGSRGISNDELSFLEAGGGAIDMDVEGVCSRGKFHGFARTARRSARLVLESRMHSSRGSRGGAVLVRGTLVGEEFVLPFSKLNIRAGMVYWNKIREWKESIDLQQTRYGLSREADDIPS